MSLVQNMKPMLLIQVCITGSETFAGDQFLVISYYSLVASH